MKSARLSKFIGTFISIKGKDCSLFNKLYWKKIEQNIKSRANRQLGDKGVGLLGEEGEIILRRLIDKWAKRAGETMADVESKVRYLEFYKEYSE